jgi:hypothetical protein
MHAGVLFSELIREGSPLQVFSKTVALLTSLFCDFNMK